MPERLPGSTGNGDKPHEREEGARDQGAGDARAAAEDETWEDAQGEGAGEDIPVDFDTFCEWADGIVASIPERLLEELTGGIQIDRAARRLPNDPPGVYLLGEYIIEPHLGRFIRIYYGSFIKTLAGEPAAVWYDELEETILHELRHHIEALAGVDWLGVEDLRHLHELWEEARRGEVRPGERADPRNSAEVEGDDVP